MDDPSVVVSAVEPGAAGGAEIRLVNASAEVRRVRLRWNGRAGELSRTDLRGAPRPDAALELAPDGSASLELRPFEIAGFRAGADRA